MGVRLGTTVPGTSVPTGFNYGELFYVSDHLEAVLTSKSIEAGVGGVGYENVVTLYGRLAETRHGIHARDVMYARCR